MNAVRASKNASKTRGRPFAPGNSGGPGRPAGSRNGATLLLDAIGEENGEAILRKVVEKANKGDMRAAELVLSRLWPPRKGRPLSIKMPALKTAADVSSAIETILNYVANGTLTPDEGQTVAAIIEGRRKAIELVEIEERLTALEASNAK